ncbi:hypothetical protein V1522DRAFT_248937 [Lipomyces starkeyi]
MRFLTAAAISGIIAIVYAQSISDLPLCAQTCAVNAIQTSGCELLDVHCFCTAVAFIQIIASCVSVQCDAQAQQATFQFAENLCLSASVTLSGIESLLTAATTSSFFVSTSSEVVTSTSPTPPSSSGQTQCDACVQVSSQYNQTCTVYYEQIDQTIIVTTDYYDCICSLKNEYVACAACTYDNAADYQSWYNDFVARVQVIPWSHIQRASTLHRLPLPSRYSILQPSLYLPQKRPRLR